MKTIAQKQLINYKTFQRTKRSEQNTQSFSLNLIVKNPRKSFLSNWGKLNKESGKEQVCINFLLYTKHCVYTLTLFDNK